MKKNIKKKLLIFERGACIGDLFLVLGEGLVAFKEKPFELIIGHHAEQIKKDEKKYLDYYKEICGSFKLCKSLQIMNFDNNINLQKHFNQQRFKDKYNIHYVKSVGHENRTKHNVFLMEKMEKYFVFNESKEIKKIIKKDKINICIHFKIGEKRSVDAIWPNPLFLKRCINLEKWKNFIAYLAGEKDINIICIGPSNKKSPSYVSKDAVSDLLCFKNVYFSFLNNDSLLTNIYFIKKTDLFIGCNSGPSSIAWMFGRPSLVYDHGFLREYAIKLPPPHELLPSQKIFWEKQSFDEMKNIYNGYMKSIFSVFKDKTNYREQIDVEYEKLNKSIVSLFKSIKNIENVRGWNSRDEAYYSLFLLCLKEKKYKKAMGFYKKSNDFIDFKDLYQFYNIARLFKEGKEYNYAKIFFKKAIVWSKEDKTKDIMIASYFHLGEIFYIEKKYKKAMEYFSLCIKKNSNHEKCKEYIAKLIEKDVKK